jgi:hypothetical protein
MPTKTCQSRLEKYITTKLLGVSQVVTSLVSPEVSECLAKIAEMDEAFMGQVLSYMAGFSPATFELAYADAIAHRNGVIARSIAEMENFPSTWSPDSPISFRDKGY